VDRSAAWKAAAVGAVLAALATLPGLGGGTLWDNSETAYGEVAREVLLYRDWVVMHLNGAPWFVQPPLYFWIAAAFAKIFGIGPFALRLPSALATIGIAVAVAYAVARAENRRVALLTVLVLCTMLMQAIVGRLAIMDALLDLAVCVAILTWYAALRGSGNAAWLGGWAALAFGVLAKGPVAPAVVLLVLVPWVLWERRLGGRLHAPSLGVVLGGAALAAAIAVPWFALLVARVGPEALGELVGHYTVGRYLGTIENQSGPLWYYLPVVILGVFPWFAFVPAALAAAWHAPAGERGMLARLSLVWVVVPFVFFSFANTKLPNYIALELPAFAIVLALWFDGVVDAEDRRTALVSSAVVPVTLAALALAIRVFARDNRLADALPGLLGDLVALGATMLAGSVACGLLLLRRSTARYAPYALGLSGLIAILVIVLVAEPRAEALKPIPELAAVIRAQRHPGDVVAIQSIGGSNGLVFYTEPPVAILDSPDDAPHSPASDPRAVICKAPRAFVVTRALRPNPDPAYGRRRRIVARSNNAVLLLYDGPPCEPVAERRFDEAPMRTR
jgi:4-amino-4-deoxy-L-arabinose transferase-like glycosyltransferase